jgi:hypothetical protein
MTSFDRTKFTEALARVTLFTSAQAIALADALESSLTKAVVPGESREAAPLRGAGVDLS